MYDVDRPKTLNDLRHITEDVPTASEVCVTSVILVNLDNLAVAQKVQSLEICHKCKDILTT